MSVDISKARSLQGAIRLVAESEGMEWFPGRSRAYKDRSPGGKVSIKLDHVRVRKADEKAIEAALQKAFPTAKDTSAWDWGTVHVWFDEDPGIGEKINDIAYQKRLDTLSKDIKSLMITSGKSMDQILKNLKSKVK